MTVAVVGHWAPLGHSLHVLERALLAKVPGLQGLQEPDPAGAEKPAAQTLHVLAWAPEAVPAGQVLQPVLPRVLAYWPGAQASHESWAVSGL